MAFKGPLPTSCTHPKLTLNATHLPNEGTQSNPPRMSHLLYGRSTRDVNDEVVKLRNEIFNLKLRLYIKEQNGAEVSKIKELDYAKAIINELRLELNEKTELLKDAAVAITEHEERDRELVIESQTKIAKLEEYIAHMQNGNPLKTKRVIEHLASELAELNQKYLCCEKKFRNIVIANSEMRDALEDNYIINGMAKKLISLQKKYINECLAKLEALRTNDVLAELKVRKELMKEVKRIRQAISYLLHSNDTHEIRENCICHLVDEYEADFIKSKTKIQNIMKYISEWQQEDQVYMNLNDEISGINSQNSSGVSSLGGRPLVPVKSEAFAEVIDLPKHGKPDSHKEQSLTGLRQFVECWGRKYRK